MGKVAFNDHQGSSKAGHVQNQRSIIDQNANPRRRQGSPQAGRRRATGAPPCSAGRARMGSRAPGAGPAWIGTPPICAQWARRSGCGTCGPLHCAPAHKRHRSQPWHQGSTCVGSPLRSTPQKAEQKPPSSLAWQLQQGQEQQHFTHNERALRPKKQHMQSTGIWHL